MPIQAPQWTDYLNCPVCCREFGPPPRSPISLGCGHTLCRNCLKHLHRKQCPFDQTVIQVDLEELVVNTALLQLAGYPPPAQPYHPPCIKALPEHDRHSYDVVVRCMEHLAVFLKYCGNANNNISGSRLSRPMQRKIVTLLQCGLTDEEGRGRAARAARSLGERTVTELILQYQNPQQLSANLWAAVRARGCQFLGPAMQEEVLKLVLLALEDGSALSRKVLVMFVVQRLEPHFPQASKTSIGHVVQLLYRASCFKVSKRESDSSLMQLKEEFRTYESLRREHDAQIVQIANEAGLRIAPDQWSSLLYGDTVHKSHMQSIIDKLQTPQSFAQSVQELFIAQQRTGDSGYLVVMSMHLDRLANIDASPDATIPTWSQLAETLTSLKEVVSGLVVNMHHQSNNRDNNPNQNSERTQESSNSMPNVPGSSQDKYLVRFCVDASTRAYCPRGASCPYIHPEDEKYVALRHSIIEGTTITYASAVAGPPQNYPGPMPMTPAPGSYYSSELNNANGNGIPKNYQMPGMMRQPELVTGVLTPAAQQPRYVPIYEPDGSTTVPQRFLPIYDPDDGTPRPQRFIPVYEHHETSGPRQQIYRPIFEVEQPGIHRYMPIYKPDSSHYRYKHMAPLNRAYMPKPLPPGLPLPPGMKPVYVVNPPSMPPPPIQDNATAAQFAEPMWPPVNNSNQFFPPPEIRNVAPGSLFTPNNDQGQNQVADDELEQELKDLERRIDTEFKSTD